MKISGSIGISTNAEIGWSLVSPDLMEWAEETFGKPVQSGKLSVKVESGNPLALEFLQRVRLESESFPASFWRIVYSRKEIEAASFLSVWCSLYIAEMARPPKEDELEVAATSVR
jgi:hypothetical protein